MSGHTETHCIICSAMSSFVAPFFPKIFLLCSWINHHLNHHQDLNTLVYGKIYRKPSNFMDFSHDFPMKSQYGGSYLDHI